MRSLMAFIFVLMCAGAQDAHAETYTNRDYGFSVDVPEELARCGPGEADHGVGAYLDGMSAAVNDGCAARPTRRVFTIFAEYSDDTSLKDASRIDCKPDIRSIVKRAPSNLKLGHRASFVCRYDQDGWIDVVVSTECAVPPSLSRICHAWLHTRSEHFNADLQVFRKIIDSVRFIEVVDYVPGKPYPE
ncbi:hypothetical protein [Rhizomicrobium electricum]|uniref:Uncharacterized protein n=1 Tax=Rhizomicrobium electricum TaxID=480070 RepID=A0ABP3PB94_9PROT|nr:hypothetical protein [Rhizomicrobium electricum]NIJ48270.1 hypothetical protein [Rhizomicrobium electricum]